VAEPAEVRLPGGNLGGAIRAGDTVHRAAGPWTPAVHALLGYLAPRLPHIPRVLGFDARGREVLSYLPGQVTADGPAVLSLACVRGTSAVLAIAYGVKPVAGQQELVLHFDQRRVMFVVKPDAIKAGKMVEASAKAGPALLASIRSSTSIEADYAGTKLGPFPAPPPALGQAFARRCGPLI